MPTREISIILMAILILPAILKADKIILKNGEIIEGSDIHFSEIGVSIYVASTGDTLIKPERKSYSFHRIDSIYFDSWKARNKVPSNLGIPTSFPPLPTLSLEEGIKLAGLKLQEHQRDVFLSWGLSILGGIATWLAISNNDWFLYTAGIGCSIGALVFTIKSVLDIGKAGKILEDAALIEKYQKRDLEKK